MPIEIESPIRVLEQEQFHRLDRQIMGVVFAVHNEFGRLLDEEVYKREVAARCAQMGILPVQREVRIRVTHDTFVKDYSMDLLFSQGAMLEAKAAETLAPLHRSQSLNYLLFAGLRHGKLVNFRTVRVQHEFVSTTLTPEERRRFTVNHGDWLECDEGSRLIKAKMLELLADWGAFLDVALYREGLVHFMGGAASVSKALPVYSGSRQIGTQMMNMISDKVGFALTCMQARSKALREHLERLLQHVPLKAIQWINLNRHQIEFRTLSSPRF
jgi:GxxExxY protein